MRIVFLIIIIILFGCSTNVQQGPPTVTKKSTGKSQLEDRVSFIEQYVNFDRNYKKLEYDIAYFNGGGGLIPGSSEWDIRILAVVPASEIDEWIPPEAVKKSKKTPAWLAEIPGNITTKNITEWYELNGIEIGIDRKTSTIAYRNTTLAKI